MRPPAHRNPRARRGNGKLARHLALGAVLLGLPGVSNGAERPTGKHWTFSAYFENDLFARTDEHYTSGVKLAWVSPDLTVFRDSTRLPDWSHALIDELPFIDDPALQRNIAISVGQNIYTPEDIETRAVVRNDRPYAGWLYGSVAFHNRNADWMDVIELEGGFVGPLSMAEQAQNGVHALRGLSRANGWRHQLNTEPGVNLIWERKWRMTTLRSSLGLEADLVSNAGGSLGNVSTYLNAGAEVRMGWNLPKDFGTSLIRASGVTDAPITGSRRRPGIHLFASAAGRLVGRDIFLDGNTFTDSHSVDKKRLVADFAAGISIVNGPVKLSFSRAMRTREFHGQRRAQHFGSISLSYTY